MRRGQTASVFDRCDHMGHLYTWFLHFLSDLQAKVCVCSVCLGGGYKGDGGGREPASGTLLCACGSSPDCRLALRARLYDAVRVHQLNPALHMSHLFFRIAVATSGGG